jgi:hypothetical protein
MAWFVQNDQKVEIETKASGTPFEEGMHGRVQRLKP